MRAIRSGPAESLWFRRRFPSLGTPLAPSAVAQTVIRGKAVQSRQTSANLLEHSAGEPPEYLVMSEPRDFAGSLNRFRAAFRAVSGRPVRFHDHPRSEEEK